MNISGQITGINYTTKLSKHLEEFSLEEFDINDAPSACIVSNGGYQFAVSKWVSPKRTRSYPYERVYDTLSASKKITVIPIIKDEGAKGDRDFLQWDTISLMSHKALLRLTSTKLKGCITSDSSATEIEQFCHTNSLIARHSAIIEALIEEANANNFIVIIEHSL